MRAPPTWRVPVGDGAKRTRISDPMLGAMRRAVVVVDAVVCLWGRGGWGW